MNTGEQWASILSRLSSSKTSIDGAAAFALDKPLKAFELLAAIVARLQVPQIRCAGL